MLNPNRLSPPVLLSCVAVLAALAGCNPFHRGEKIASCNKAQVYAAAQSLPPLQIPAGLDAPNTRAAMKIPDLDEPEAPRKAGDPCLDAPPKFSATARLEPLPKAKRGKGDAAKVAPPAPPAAGAAPAAGPAPTGNPGASPPPR